MVTRIDRHAPCTIWQVHIYLNPPQNLSTTHQSKIPTGRCRRRSSTVEMPSRASASFALGPTCVCVFWGFRWKDQGVWGRTKEAAF